MDENRRDQFVLHWRRFFGEVDLPMAISYTDEKVDGTRATIFSGPCVIGMLPLVLKGKTLCLSAESRVCGGAKRYLGFMDQSSIPNFEHFLSYGIPGKVRGERYKKSPELVRESMRTSHPFRAPKRFIVFKRWDLLSESDAPEVVVFLADPDTASGLFALANFDEADSNAVICPFGSGCSSIMYHPYMELQSAHPRCVLGMFDISARPYVKADRLSFAIPFPKFERMAVNMGESFLTTSSWKKVSRRILAGKN